MRRRRSSKSSWAISTVNGRISVCAATSVLLISTSDGRGVAAPNREADVARAVAHERPLHDAAKPPWRREARAHAIAGHHPKRTKLTLRVANPLAALHP